MRALPAVIAALCLSVAPVLAQGKTKTPAPADASTLAIEVVTVCQDFASQAPDALDSAIEKGWDAYEATGESPYVQNFNASKVLPGIGTADMFVLIEDYPDSTLGYCRMDAMEPAGVDGNVAIQAIQGLERYEGQAIQNGDGSFASLRSSDGDMLLLAHWSAESFVVQLTAITPKAED